MKKPASCPRCTGSISEGFLVDRGDYGQAHVGTWQAGEPRKSMWLGLRQRKEDQMEITTWRCDRCGYLESYANAK